MKIFVLFNAISKLPIFSRLRIETHWCMFQKENKQTFFSRVRHLEMIFNRNGILLPKLYRPTVRKNCSSDREKFLKFEAEGREYANFLRSLEQFIQTVKSQNNFW